MSKATTAQLGISEASPEMSGDAPEELGADVHADFAPLQEIAADPDESETCTVSR